VVAGTDIWGNQIRAFSDSKIQAQITAAVAGLRPGAHGAIIAVGNKQEQKLAVVLRPFNSDKFSVVGTLSHSTGQAWKKWTPEVAVRYEF
jgi:hypothetical protein